MKRLWLVLIPALMIMASANFMGGAAAQGSTTLTTKTDAKLGTILADAKGMTVYLFTNDTKENESTCTDKCATFWPPVLATGDVTLPAGVEGTIATFKRADGTEQVSYNGIPLYYFDKDKDAEDAYGQNVGGVWFVVTPGLKFGATKPIAPTVMTKDDPKLGTILTDAKGMTLYLFTKDTKENESTCTDKCLAAWPPLTVKSADDVLLGGKGVTGKLATFKRADGSLQVSYNGIPLYYFAKDKDKEDAYGQGVGKVWYVVSPDATFGAAPTGSPAATAATAPAASAATAVTIANFAFDAASVDVAVGATVTWTNNDSVAHTVTADDGSFESGSLDSGKTFSFTFTKAGTYTYHCAIHPNMTGTIVVK